MPNAFLYLGVSLKNLKRVRVCGVTEDAEGNCTIIERGSKEKPDYWTVYGTDSEGHEWALADFQSRFYAEAWAQALPTKE